MIKRAGITRRNIIVVIIITLLLFGAGKLLLASGRDTLEDYPPEKRAFLRRLEAGRNSSPAPKYLTAPRPSSSPEPPRLHGIIEDAPPPFPSAQYHITNEWAGDIDGRYVEIFAGAMTSDLRQGLVIVQIDDPSPSAGGLFKTPTRAGLVRFVSAKGHLLTLRSDSGVEFVFDADSNRFQ